MALIVTQKGSGVDDVSSIDDGFVHAESGTLTKEKKKRGGRGEMHMYIVIKMGF